MKPCRICGRPDDRIQIRTGSGICCNQCEKIENDDIDREQALDYLWSINTILARLTFYKIKKEAEDA